MPNIWKRQSKQTGYKIDDTVTWDNWGEGLLQKYCQGKGEQLGMIKHLPLATTESYHRSYFLPTSYVRRARGVE